MSRNYPTSWKEEQATPLLLIRQLLELELNNPGVIVAVGGFHVLDDAGAEFAGEFTPGFAVVLGRVLAVFGEVDGKIAAAVVGLTIGRTFGRLAVWLALLDCLCRLLQRLRGL